MNFNLKVDPSFLLEYLNGKSIVFGGIQYIFRFPNNYGASVIKFKGSYGFANDKWELGVIRFDESNFWDLCYTTPIAGDVVDNLTDEEVEQYLNKIKELPEA